MSLLSRIRTRHLDHPPVPGDAREVPIHYEKPLLVNTHELGQRPSSRPARAPYPRRHPVTTRACAGGGVNTADPAAADRAIISVPAEPTRPGSRAYPASGLRPSTEPSARSPLDGAPSVVVLGVGGPAPCPAAAAALRPAACRLWPGRLWARDGTARAAAPSLNRPRYPRSRRPASAHQQHRPHRGGHRHRPRAVPLTFPRGTVCAATWSITPGCPAISSSCSITPSRA